MLGPRTGTNQGQNGLIMDLYALPRLRRAPTCLPRKFRLSKKSRSRRWVCRALYLATRPRSVWPSPTTTTHTFHNTARASSILLRRLLLRHATASHLAIVLPSSLIQYLLHSTLQYQLFNRPRQLHRRRAQTAGILCPQTRLLCLVIEQTLRYIQTVPQSLLLRRSPPRGFYHFTSRTTTRCLVTIARCSLATTLVKPSRARASLECLPAIALPHLQPRLAT